jgi:hypothetical protein
MATGINPGTVCPSVPTVQIPEPDHTCVFISSSQHSPTVSVKGEAASWTLRYLGASQRLFAGPPIVLDEPLIRKAQEHRIGGIISCIHRQNSPAMLGGCDLLHQSLGRAQVKRVHETSDVGRNHTTVAEPANACN